MSNDLAVMLGLWHDRSSCGFELEFGNSVLRQGEVSGICRGCMHFLLVLESSVSGQNSPVSLPKCFGGFVPEVTSWKPRGKCTVSQSACQRKAKMSP